MWLAPGPQLEEVIMKKWPAWYYGPDGQAAIFENADNVPSGWVDDPRKLGKAAVDKGMAAKGKAVLKELGMSRKEAVVELRAAGINVPDNAKADEVYALVAEHLVVDE